MKTGRIAALLLCGTMLAAAQPSHAQDEVLVMRRAIAEPTGQTTIQPSPDFIRIPLTLRDPGDNGYASSGVIGLEIDTLGCLMTNGIVSTDEALCVEGSGPASGDLVNFPAEMDPDLRTFYVERGAYEEFLPGFSERQIEELCTGRVLIEGDQYQGSCDPAAVVNTHAWAIYGFADPYSFRHRFETLPNGSSDTDRVSLYVSRVICIDTKTQEHVDNAQCGSISKSPSGDLVELDALFSPEFRRIHVSQADIAAAAPEMSEAAVAGRCGMSLQVSGSAWELDCGPPKDPADHARVAARLVDPRNNWSVFAPDSQYVNSTSDTDVLRLSVSGTNCHDVSSGAPVRADTRECSFLTDGHNNYDIVELPAAFVPDLRSVYLDPADLQGLAAYGTTLGSSPTSTKGISEICDSIQTGFSVDFGQSGSSERWMVHCGAPENPSDYERTVHRLVDPNDFHPAGNDAVRFANSAFDATAFTFSVKSTACRNIVNGADGASKCDSIPGGANIYDLVAIPGVFERQMREIYVDETVLASMLGSAEAAYRDYHAYYMTAAEICSKGMTQLKVGPSSDRQQWTMVCSEPVDVAEMSRNVTHLADPYDHYPSGDYAYREANADPSSSEFRFATYLVDCRNDRTGETFTRSRCNHLDSGAHKYDLITVPAAIVPELREFYVDREQLEAMLPHLSSIDDSDRTGSNVNSACAGSEAYFSIGGNSYRMFCGEADDPRRYAEIAYALIDPVRASGVDTAHRNTNSDVSSGSFAFSVYRTRCVEKDSGAFGGSKCRYLTQDKISEKDLISVPVSYDQDNKRIEVTRAALEGIMPHGATANYYSGGQKSISQICSGGMSGLTVAGQSGWTMVCTG